ncbi:hypothetical protein EV182_007550, partial [Spiromyces aspiralis]
PSAFMPSFTLGANTPTSSNLPAAISANVASQAQRMPVVSQLRSTAAPTTATTIPTLSSLGRTIQEKELSAEQLATISRNLTMYSNKLLQAAAAGGGAGTQDQQQQAVLKQIQMIQAQINQKLAALQSQTPAGEMA